MRQIGVIALLWLATALPASAQELVTDLTDHLVRITTAFHGADVVLFGTAPGGGDVVVTVSGPLREAVVRRKSRVAGIWLNNTGLVFSDVPGFYATFASRPLAQLMSPETQALESVGLASVPMPAENAEPGDDVAAYRHALIAAFQARGLYARDPGPIKFLGGKLFRATIDFPSDTPVGEYTIESLLIRNGAVVASDSTPFAVEKAGLPAQINDFSQDHGLAYGVLAVAASAMTGWLSALLFRRG